VTTPEVILDAELVDDGALPAVRPDAAPRFLVDKHTVLAPGQLPPTEADRPAYSEADFRVSQRTIELNQGSVPDNTKANRDSVGRAYRAWCARAGRVAVPCTTATYTEYGTHLMEQGHKTSTIRTYMAHVMALQPKGDRPDPSLFRDNLKGYRAENPRANRTRRAYPLQLPHVVAMTDACDPTTAIGRRDAALIVLGYRFLARRIEAADLLIEDLTIGERTITVYLPKDKTHQDEDQEIVLHDHPALQLVARIRAWLADLAQLGVTSGPLFRALTKTGRLASRHHATARGDALRGNTVNDIIKQRFAQARLDSGGKPVTAHGLRAGAATDLAEAKVHGKDLNAAGRWAENSRIPETVYVRPARDRSFDPFKDVRLS
jgi:integrase